MLRRLLRQVSSSRRLGIFLCFVGFVWGIGLINVSLVGDSSPKDSEDLKVKDEILQLSEKYVRALAHETQDTIDGPYAGRLTGYDLKKTMAVLLSNIMDRMERLEKKVDTVLLGSANRTGAEQSRIMEAIAQAVEPGDSQIKLLPPSPAPAQEEGAPGKPVGVKARLARFGGNAALHNSPTPLDKTRHLGDKDGRAKHDLLLGAQEDCTLTKDERDKFPACEGKLAWMKGFWKSDPCYAENGVDGSDCSFRVYLSEIETWCPLLPGRTVKTRNVTINNSENDERWDGMVKAEIQLDRTPLMNLLQDPGQRNNYEWIRQRIARMWPNWVSAAKTLVDKEAFTNRRKKRILVHLGLLSKKSGFKIAENSFKGGPLGELVQWSDIISALYIMGHQLTITSEVEQLSAYLIELKIKKQACPTPKDSLGKRKPDLIYTDLVGYKQLKQAAKLRTGNNALRILAKFPNAESQCQNRAKLPLDMIYTDIVGLIQFKRKVKHGYGKFSCLLRIIDSFGTEPAFNLDTFAKAHKLKTQWGMQNLVPQQFYTMFPHSPDNSFMGFVIEQHLNDTNQHEQSSRKPQAVVYGKSEYMWQGKEPYLSVIKKYVDIHGTVFLETGQSDIVPKFVHNHGILSGYDLHKLLRESKLFIGLGFPYEGPAPLEAIAQGNAFINPKFDPPHNSQNTKFFKGKPTLRKLTSQHPYAEEFIAEPHVYTVDIEDLKEVDRVVQEALKSVDEGKVQPYMPYEFTNAGMIERLGAYIEHQDFCSPNPPLWPPPEEITTILAAKGLSCKDACRDKTMICEPSFFKRMNTKELVEKYAGVTCAETSATADIYWPAYEPTASKCVLQQEPLLFSCVGELADVSRVCPCRDFTKGQTALCAKCV